MEINLRRRPVSGPLFGFYRSWVRPAVAWMLLATTSLSINSCNYYRAREKGVSPETVNMLADSKMFVVHQGTATWQLYQPRLNGNALEGTIDGLNQRLTPYREAPAKGLSPRYKSGQRSTTLNIVHIYLTNSDSLSAGPASIPLTTIQRLELLEQDTGKTVASYVATGVGITLGVVAVLTVIVGLLKSSCPFVYAHDGHEYRFVGEAYGGAIFAPAERHDYLPLPSIRPVEGQYQLKISNELKERQYTNLAELWVVQHDIATQVLLDQRGQVQTVQAPQPPIQAQSPSGRSYVTQLHATDHHAVLFDEETPGNGANELVMTFVRPVTARRGKLVLHAQNSLWLDYLYGEFIKKFGGAYNNWAAQQKTQPAAINQQWTMDQFIPLHVYVENGQTWQLVETIPTVGPLAARDMVVPLDLPTSSSRQVRIKLACGFMFWEVDYAALDCSANEPVQLEKCAPKVALTEQGRDVHQQLLLDDSLYLKQLHPGAVVSLRYDPRLPAPGTGERRTAFLHTKGYYEHVREFSGLPDVPALLAFRQAGRFVEFSKEKYREAARSSALPVIASR
jgi:hypothetical protein